MCAYVCDGWSVQTRADHRNHVCRLLNKVHNGATWQIRTIGTRVNRGLNTYFFCVRMLQGDGSSNNAVEQRCADGNTSWLCKRRDDNVVAGRTVRTCGRRPLSTSSCRTVTTSSSSSSSRHDNAATPSGVDDDVVVGTRRRRHRLRGVATSS